ncbi:MAG: hypothetical protein HZA08_11950 [Nitrospirae bacterium]|nr:hypothetical protein [Nitrospirota bacterium]
MSGSWDCPHEVNNKCLRVRNHDCDPGMKGCILAGRFTFSNPAKNLRIHPSIKENKTKSSNRKNKTLKQKNSP